MSKEEIIPQSQLYPGMPFWKIRPFYEIYEDGESKHPKRIHDMLQQLGKDAGLTDEERHLKDELVKQIEL